MTNTLNAGGMSERRILAGQLTGRYGALALTRAAGEAAAAQRRGDHERLTLWQDVIADLRHEIAAASAG